MKFDDHLNFLRRVARRKKRDFCDLLLLLVNAYQVKPFQFRLGDAFGDALEKHLIEEYRIVYRMAASSRGGKVAAQNKRKNKLNQRNTKIISAAQVLLSQGRGKHELAGILAIRNGLTTRQIRNVLKEMKKAEMQ